MFTYDNKNDAVDVVCRLQIFMYLWKILNAQNTGNVKISKV